ncbi:hypothetical protein Pfo_006796 [Paulownia fortunei]|nr:hypothetical protein Pfo_006796 [Paulownia fortunei]
MKPVFPLVPSDYLATYFSGHGQIAHEDIEENNLDPDEGNHMLCKACSLPIFSTPLYNVDSNVSHFPLHRDCANLPMELQHIKHPNQTLVLIKKLDADDDRNIDFCHNCCEQCKGFIYRCSESKCIFALDVLCAMPIGNIKILHRSHKHELVPIRGEALIPCGACEFKHQGLSYLCNVCGFWIHRDCALLPNTIQHKKHGDGRGHLLSLTYTRPLRWLRSFNTCAICQGKITSLGNYFCRRCEFVAHIKCAISDPQSFRPVLSVSMGHDGLIHFPMADEQTSVVRYLLENRSSKSTIEEDSIHGEKLFEGKHHHHHPLIFYDHTSTSDDHQYHLCNGCVQPISPPFYCCPQCSDFFLHSVCANLPSEHRFTGSGNPLVLLPRAGDFFSRFKCHGCNLYCNGFAYGLKNSTFSLDVECTFLPDSITHEAHGKSHILILTSTPAGLPVHGEWCQCCGENLTSICYECSSCRHFKIHARCAVLPTSVRHKFDRHPLKLISNSSSKLLTVKEDEQHFCEICEQDMDTKCWFYRCDECLQSFHVDCIPCVGSLSRIKFGGTIRVRLHDCPLTSIRLLTTYNYRCGICQKIIRGFVDDIAFECSKCDFRIHYDCARKQHCVKHISQANNFISKYILIMSLYILK